MRCVRHFLLSANQYASGGTGWRARSSRASAWCGRCRATPCAPGSRVLRHVPSRVTLVQRVVSCVDANVAVVPFSRSRYGGSSFAKMEAPQTNQVPGVDPTAMYIRVPAAPRRVAYHGTSREAWALIRVQGLRAGKRRFVHFVPGAAHRVPTPMQSEVRERPLPPVESRNEVSRKA